MRKHINENRDWKEIEVSLESVKEFADYLNNYILEKWVQSSIDPKVKFTESEIHYLGMLVSLYRNSIEETIRQTILAGKDTIKTTTIDLFLCKFYDEASEEEKKDYYYNNH